MLDTGGVRRFADLNGAWFPDDLASRVDRANEADRLALAVDAAVTLCEELVRGGAPGVHLYCMNHAGGTAGVLRVHLALNAWSGTASAKRDHVDMAAVHDRAWPWANPVHGVGQAA